MMLNRMIQRGTEWKYENLYPDTDMMRGWEARLMLPLKHGPRVMVCVASGKGKNSDEAQENALLNYLKKQKGN